MRPSIGIDIVHIPTFAASACQGGDTFLANIFSDEELDAHPTDESRAGIFAAKEALQKAVGLVPGSWRSVAVLHESTGRPVVRGLSVALPAACDVSIAHHGDYAIAVVVVLYE